MKLGRRRRVVATMVASLLAAGTVAGASSAQAAGNPYTYADVCPGYSLRRTLFFTDYAGTTQYGKAQLGISYRYGRVCVATFKSGVLADDTRRLEMSAIIRIGSTTHQDIGFYTRYAGENCTSPRPANCSAIHARDKLFRWGGHLVDPGGTGRGASEYLTWDDIT